MREFLATKFFKPRFTPPVDRERLPMIRNEKMAHKIDDSRLAFDDETKNFGEIEESSLRLFFMDKNTAT